MLCQVCKCHVTPTPPKTVWKIVNLVYWVSSLTIATGFSLLAGLNLVLAPLAIVIGFSIATSARRMNTWTCPHCRAELAPPAAEIAPAIPAAPIAHVPAEAHG